jgi:hypothetical protein
MAGADASIYAMMRPPEKQAGPLDNFGAMMQLRAMGDASALQALQRRQAEEGIEENSALKRLFAMGRDPTVQEIAAVAPKFAPTYQKGKADLAKTEAETEAKRVAARRDAIAMHRDVLGSINDQGAYDQWRASLLTAVPNFEKMVPAQFSPEAKRDLALKGDELVKALTPEFREFDVGGEKRFVDVNPYTNPAIKGLAVKKTLTPGEVQTGAHQSATLAETRRHHGATEATQAASVGVPAGFRRTADGSRLEPIPGGPADQPTATQKDELTSISRTQQQAGRLKAMFKPEFVGFKGTMGEFMDKYGSQVVPGIDGDQERIQFRALAADLENQYIKAISGATVPTTEVPRLRRAIPTASDSPAQYKAKLEEMERNLAELPNVIRNGAKPGAPDAAPPKPAPQSPDLSGFKVIRVQKPTK